MLLDSARGLKQQLRDTVLAPFSDEGYLAKSYTQALEQMGPGLGSTAAAQPSIALGIARASAADFQLAVRIQRSELIDGNEVKEIRKRSMGEVDVRFIGRVTGQATRWGQQRHRPLQIGISVGNAKAAAAGTLGAFVRKRDTKAVCILSNNHVLANENQARIGDAILQPGGKKGEEEGDIDPADLIATLAKTVRLRKEGVNLVDAAMAELAAGQEFDPGTIRGLGNLAGLGAEFVDVGTKLAKLGRMSGLTHGRVTVFELDTLIIDYGIGKLRFDQQLEIEGAGDDPFSQTGDSGSLIVEADTRLAVALLFACSSLGGANNKGLTYASPLRFALDALKADLVVK
ncbi:hypothetical protein [Zavarzinella formosa]|uniref:hypothetical protein n=1 Tax=Zavarzinella formosa TaxID=360055 RepID=UPI000369D49F|nr:hypothetical protein [Zavarzinella formosa]